MVFQKITKKLPDGAEHKIIKAGTGLFNENLEFLDSFNIDFEYSTNDCFYSFSDYNKKLLTIGKAAYNNNELVNHVYIFTGEDYCESIKADSQSSIFNLKSFAITPEAIASHNIDSVKIYIGANSFNLNEIKCNLEYLGINRAEFKKLLFACFKAFEEDDTLFIISDKNDNMLSLMRAIYTVFVPSLLKQGGFITHCSQKPSAKNIRFVVMSPLDFSKHNAKLVFDLSKDNYFQYDLKTDEFLDFLSSFIFDSAPKCNLYSYFNYIDKYALVCSSIEALKLIYQFYEIKVNRSHKYDLKDVYYCALKNTDKISKAIFEEDLESLIATIKAEAAGVKLNKKNDLSLIYDSLFILRDFHILFSNACEYSSGLLNDADMINTIQQCISELVCADVSALNYFWQINNDFANSLSDKSVKSMFFTMYENVQSAALASADLSDEATRGHLENLNDFQLSLISDETRKKLKDILLYIRLKNSYSKDISELCAIVSENKLNSDLISRIDKQRLIDKFYSNNDIRKLNTFYNIFMLVFDDYCEVFEIILKGQDIYELINFVNALDQKAVADDLFLMGDMLENYNKNKLVSHIKSFFSQKDKREILSAASQNDAAVLSFEKKYNLTQKKGLFKSNRQAF